MAREQLGAAPSGSNDAATKNYTDNAAVASAAKLTTPRTISLTGSVLNASTSFDGSGNVSINTGSTVGTDNSDVWYNGRVFRNANSSTLNDGIYVGYANSNSGATRIFGGGSITNAMTFADTTIDVGGIGDSNARFNVGHTKHAAIFRTFDTAGGFFAAYFQRTGSVGNVIAFYYGGTNAGWVYTNGSAVSYNSASDYRLKENVNELFGGLDRISALRPVSYNWIESGDYGEGFIAHELQEVIPEAVTGEKDAVLEDGSISPQGVDLGKIVPHLVSAVQELKAELDVAKARIAQLEGQTNG